MSAKTEVRERPKRIQRKRAKGWKMPPNTVYVGRPTKWGNPFNGDDCSMLATSDEYVELYRGMVKYLVRTGVMDMKELRGKRLACWCPLDAPCHADVLLELANQ